MAVNSTNNNEKIAKKRFNAIDFLVLVIVLGVLCAAAFAYIPGLFTGKNSTGNYLEISFVIRDTDASNFSYLTSGEEVLCDGKVIGTVKTVTVTDSGNADKQNVVISIASSVDEFEDRYEINGIVFASGLNYSLEFTKCVCDALCFKLSAGGAS